MTLTDEQINQSLAGADGWRRENDQIVRDFKLTNFKAAMDFVNKVADQAEAMDHHPDILIHGWNHVRLSLMTHSEGGLTAKDFQLAGQINQL